MVANKVDKFDQDLNFVMQSLKEVLEELQHKDLIRYIPWLDEKQDASLTQAPSPYRLVQLLSISFSSWA